jgi:hypothetical protein
MENIMNTKIKTLITATIAMTIGVSSVHATEDFCARVKQTPDGFLRCVMALEPSSR